MNINLSQIIKTPKFLFPLNLPLFDELMTVKRYQLKATCTDDKGDISQITDFRALFYFIVGSMKKGGVTFFSPGGSPQRRFLYWYNAHYWTNMNFEVKVAVRSHHEGLLHSMVRQFFHSDELKITEVAIDQVGTLRIEQGNRLSALGQEFLLKLKPFKDIRDQVTFLD